MSLKMQNYLVKPLTTDQMIYLEQMHKRLLNFADTYH